MPRISISCGSRNLHADRFSGLKVWLNMVNFVYKPGHILSAPDALSCIPTLNAVGKPLTLLKGVHLALKASTDLEVLRFKSLVDNPTLEFSLNLGLIVKLALNCSPIVIPGDANLLKYTVLAELYTSLFWGDLGYHKLLELVHTRFWLPHLN